MYYSGKVTGNNKCTLFVLKADFTLKKSQTETYAYIYMHVSTVKGVQELVIIIDYRLEDDDNQCFSWLLLNKIISKSLENDVK